MSTPIQTPTTDPAPEPLLEFRNVMKIYGAGEGEVRALGGVSFLIAGLLVLRVAAPLPTAATGRG